MASETRSDRRRGVGLCLSGGGFRATLFHLGAVRRMHELGVLPQVRTISSVSGGSIFAAFLADLCIKQGSAALSISDYDDQVADPVRRFTAKDLRTWPIVAHALWNWARPEYRSRHMERRYRDRITRATLAQLPERPCFVFCATDMAFGVNWEMSREHVGSYRAGYLKGHAEWPVARAVAASASFPPVFGPLAVGAEDADFTRGGYKGSDRAKLRSRLGLSDGGVYDNMGLEPVWKEHDWVLVSDCGAPFEFDASSQPVRRLMRYATVIMNQALSLRWRMYMAGIHHEDYAGSSWAIDTKSKGAPVGYPDEVVDTIVRVRTDLDSFTEAEQRILENHGYAVADRKLNKYAADLIEDGAPPARLPNPEWEDPARASDALRESHKRFSIRRMLS